MRNRSGPRRVTRRRSIDHRQQLLGEVDGRLAGLAGSMDLQRLPGLVDLTDQRASLLERGRPAGELEWLDV